MPNTVLIVDDAAFMRMMHKEILTKHGYEVIGEAEDGVRAIKKFYELKPDIVVLDINMPVMDGVSVLQQLKKDGKARIVMCSAMSQPSIVIEALRCGAKDFIVKPFQQDRLLKNMKVELSDRRAFNLDRLNDISKRYDGSSDILSQNEVDSIMKEAIEPIFVESEMKKPPLGLKPKWIHDRDRALEILDAMGRYIEDGVKVPSEWFEELNEIL